MDTNFSIKEQRHTETFHAKNLGDYKIMTYVLQKADISKPLPVIYLLDGEQFFNDVVAFISKNKIPVIVVAVDYPDKSRRELDYLPNPPELLPEILSNGKINRLEAYGGADNFLVFLQTELKPYIEQKFYINREQQILFGHSLGGIFVLHTLFTQPNTFSDYIASSPSIWFNDRYIIQEASQFIANSKQYNFVSPIHLYLSVGELEQSLTGKEIFPSEREKQLRAQHLQNRRMVDNMQDLAKLLSHTDIHLLTLQQKIYPKQIHQTVGILVLQDRLLQLAK